MGREKDWFLCMPTTLVSKLCTSLLWSKQGILDTGQCASSNVARRERLIDLVLGDTSAKGFPQPDIL